MTEKNEISTLDDEGATLFRNVGFRILSDESLYSIRTELWFQKKFTVSWFVGVTTHDVFSQHQSGNLYFLSQYIRQLHLLIFVNDSKPI